MLLQLSYDNEYDNRDLTQYLSRDVIEFCGLPVNIVSRFDIHGSSLMDFPGEDRRKTS